MNELPTRNDLNEIRKEVSELREMIVERENNLFRALKTLASDFRKFSKGERTDFPQAAFLGVLFSYLKPRATLVVGGLVGGVLALLQIWILVNQNNILTVQNQFVRKQTIATERQALSFVVSRLDPNNPLQARIATNELPFFGVEALDTLFALAEEEGEIGFYARQAIVETYQLGAEDNFDADTETQLIEHYSDVLQTMQSAFEKSELYRPDDETATKLHEEFRLYVNWAIAALKIEHATSELPARLIESRYFMENLTEYSRAVVGRLRLSEHQSPDSIPQSEDAIIGEMRDNLITLDTFVSFECNERHALRSNSMTFDEIIDPDRNDWIITTSFIDNFVTFQNSADEAVQAYFEASSGDTGNSVSNYEAERHVNQMYFWKHCTGKDLPRDSWSSEMTSHRVSALNQIVSRYMK